MMFFNTEVVEDGSSRRCPRRALSRFCKGSTGVLREGFVSQDFGGLGLGQELWALQALRPVRWPKQRQQM